MLVRRYVGSRCGVSSRFTSDCRRSASPMITCVYSDRCGRSSSRSSSCAAPADAAERILDLVREAADQVAVRLLLLEQPLLARDLQLLVDVAELDQQRRIGGIDRRHRARQVQLALAADAELDFLLRVRRAAHHRLGDRGQQRRALAEQFARRVADEFRPRQLEQVFGSRIHVGDASVGAQHQHRGRQQAPTRVGCVAADTDEGKKRSFKGMASTKVRRPRRQFARSPTCLAISAPMRRDAARDPCSQGFSLAGRAVMPKPDPHPIAACGRGEHPAMPKPDPQVFSGCCRVPS